MRLRRVLRWTKRIVLGALALVVLVVGIALILLHTDWGRDRIRREVVSALASSFPGGVRIERVEGSVLGTLVVRGVTLNGRDGKPQVQIDSLQIDVALTPLATKTVRVNRLVADKVVVFVHEQPPEPTKPPEVTKAPSEPTTWSVEVPNVHVTGARLEIATKDGVEKIDGLDAWLSMDMPAGKPLRGHVQANASWRGKDAAVVAMLRNDKTVQVPFAAIAYGGAHVIASSVEIDGQKLAGTIAASAPAALVKSLADVELPGDVAVAAHASLDGSVQLHGTVGGNALDVLAVTDLEKQTYKAIVGAQAPDVGTLSKGKVQGRGTVVATVVGDANHVAGLVSIVGSAEGNAGSALVAIDAYRDRALVLVASSGARESIQPGSDQPPRRRGAKQRSDQGSSSSPSALPILASWRLGGYFSLAHERDRWSIARSLVKADAKGLRQDDLRVRHVHASITAFGDVDHPSGTASVQAAGIRSGTLYIPSATLAAHGDVHADGTIDIDLDKHRVVTADRRVWTGTGGHVAITETTITATELRTGTGESRLVASATLDRNSDRLAVKAQARDVSLALADPTLAGHIDADVDVTRAGGLWNGTAKLDAKHVVVPKRPPIDGTLDVKIAKRRVTAHGTATNPKIGSATFDLDVIGPPDITDGAAWKRVERSAIKRVRVALAKIDAGQLGASGSVDGELAIGTNDTSPGGLSVRGVETSAGRLDSELVLTRKGVAEIQATGKAQLAGLDPIDVDATIALPVHPFDPDAWQQLGRAALKGATIEADHIAFDPQLLARFGVKTTFSGTLATKITVGPGARTSDVVLDVHDLRAPELASTSGSIEIHATGGTDDSGMHANVTASTGGVSVDLVAKTPLTVDAALDGKARTAKIEGTLTVPKVAAREVAQLIHRKDVLSGTLGGTVTIGGTIDKPTGRAQIAVENLAVAAGIARKPPTLQKLELDARWYGQDGELELTGFEAGGRILKISARGRPDSLPTVVATIEAGNFDLAPLAAFAPGPLVGARGIVGGVLKIKGFDPQTGEVKGKLVITEARMPLSAELGTLRDGRVDLTVKKQEIVALLDGKLGAGTVKGKATLRLTNGEPVAAELAMTLRRISPIGAVQPVISADITGWFARTKTRWAGKLAVKNGNVYVPPERGHELLGLGAPGDIIFVDAKTPPPKPAKRAPRNNWLTANVDLQRAKIVVEDDSFKFDGYVRGKLDLAVGDTGLGLDGTITTETGKIDIVGRRYRLDHGVVDFDGTLDPRLDIELVRDFKQLTLTADIIGRASNPDLRLSGDPGTYTQGQLLSILAGGDPGEGGQGAAVSGGLAVFSSRLGKKLTKHLPIKPDTITYEADSVSSSRALKFGKQLSEHTSVWWRQRLEARPDENPGEGVIEWQLSTNWVLEGTAGERAKGADLMWRWRR